MDPKILEKDIIELLGLENLPEKEKTALIAKMAETILDRITLRILEELSEEDKKKFDALLKKKTSPERVDQFLETKVKNLDEIKMAEILRFKQSMVDDVKHLRKALSK